MKKVVNQRALMIKQMMCDEKLIKKPSNEPFLGTTGLNIVIDNKRSKQHQGGLNRTCQADSPGISEHMNWKRLCLMEREKNKYPARHCKVCASQKK
jgi:hypothetical protein